MIVAAHGQGFRVGEISVPTKYFPEASSINFRRSVKYGFGVLRCSLGGLRMRWGSAPQKTLQPDHAPT